MARFGDSSAVEQELAALDLMQLNELRNRFKELSGLELPKFMRRKLMLLAVSHAVQIRMVGDLDRETRRDLDRLVAEIAPANGQVRPRRVRTLREGTRLLREWQGHVHEVLVTSGGFTWRGVEYRSLSMIARTITGTRWNGWVFFGVQQGQSRVPAGAVAPRAKRPMQVRADAGILRREARGA